MTHTKNIILQHIDIFNYFKEVYLFGSSLSEKKYANDIDLLVVYENYSKQVHDEKKNIIFYLEKLLQKPIDITVLSKNELKQINFLENLETPYKRIK